MSLTVFVAVLGAAFLHAAWNAVVKGGADKRIGIGAVVLGHMPIALGCLAFVPLPEAASVPYLAAGVAIHFVYQRSLMQSYRIGDLTQVYPIARGSAPLMLARVGKTSTMWRISLVILPAGILPGQRIIAGTRSDPSKAVK